MVSDTPEKRMELLRQGQLLAGKSMTYGTYERAIETEENKSYIPALRSLLFRSVICLLLYVAISFSDENASWRQQTLEALSENYMKEDSAMVFEFLQGCLEDTGML